MLVPGLCSYTPRVSVYAFGYARCVRLSLHVGERRALHLTRHHATRAARQVATRA